MDSFSGETLKTETTTVLNSYDKKFVDLSNCLVSETNKIVIGKNN